MKELTAVQVEAGQSAYLPFTAKEQGEWIRVKIDKESNVSVSFVYTTVDTVLPLLLPYSTDCQKYRKKILLEDCYTALARIEEL